MTIQNTFTDFKRLAIAGAEISLWVFKKRPDSNGGAGDIKYTAYWVKIADAVKAELRNIVVGYQNNYVEAEAYSLLAQNNENSFLGVDLQETNFDKLKLLIDRPPEEHQATDEKQLNNAVGYVVRISTPNTVLYGVKKTTANWKTKRARNLMNLVFRQQELDIEDNPAFSLERTFDFFVLSDHILTPNKAAFESLLSYKASYKTAFTQLQVEPSFSGLFTNLQPLVTYVGSNSIHLRRMSTIQTKGLYQDLNFLTRLKQVNQQKGWNIQFHDDGRIHPTEDTVKTIIQVLLDHRLFSELSLNTYDVQSTVPV